MSKRPAVLEMLRHEFALHRLIPGVTAGLIVGLVLLMIEISLATLIFDNQLARYLPGGWGSMLTGIIVLSIVVALTGSVPFVLASPQDVTAVILAVSAAAIADDLSSPGSERQVYPTVLALMVLASVLLGLAYLAIGTFRLGRFIRLIPYPVMGGFLAGTGGLLAKGGLGVMVDGPTMLANLGRLFAPETLSRWLPGVALAALLLFLSSRVRHFLILPVILLASGALFYVVLFLTGHSTAQASAAGWLLGPFAQGYRWPPLAPAEWVDINWSVLLHQTGNLLSLVLLSTMTLLLYDSALELATRQDFDLNRDLTSNGAANLLSGILGGMPGFSALGLSLLAPRMKVHSILVPLTTAAVAGLALVVGTAPLGYLPRFVLGGIIIFVGADLLIGWLYKTWFNMPRVDWVLIAVIFLVIMAAGPLPGVAVGLAIAVGVFLVRYSRIGVVRNTLTGQTFVSNRQRSPDQEQALREHGEDTYILRLQNYLFFGTANSLLEQIRQRTEDTTQPRLRFVVLDFQRVVGMDSSAALSFARLLQTVARRDITLVLTHVSDYMRVDLKAYGLTDSTPNLKLFADLDRGVEWCEEQILAAHGAYATGMMSFAERLEAYLPPTIEPARFLPYMERRSFAAGESIMRQGEVADELYLIEAGLATVLLEMPTGEQMRLWTMEPGVWVGELGFYLGRPRSASVVADELVTVYCLSQEELARMEVEEPELAAALHRMLARVLADRLASADRTLVAMLA
ncbi:MAG: SulP family inorganic anion transporter [Anaerolineae bacterium]